MSLILMSFEISTQLSEIGYMCSYLKLQCSLDMPQGSPDDVSNTTYPTLPLLVIRTQIQ